MHVEAGNLDDEVPVKVRRLSLDEPVEREEYGWVDSVLKERGHLAPDDENLGGMSESHLPRTVLFAFVLCVLAYLLIYFARQVAAGEGRRVFPLMATLAAFMACGALAARRRFLLRFLLLLGSLCAFALLVDQFAYYHWHEQVDRVMTTLRPGLESGSSALGASLHPTSFRIDPDGEVVLRFEPPPLAWTYHLDSLSSLGHTLVAGWYRLLSRITRGRNLDAVARTIVRPHEVYAVSIMPSGEAALVCRADQANRWTITPYRAGPARQGDSLSAASLSPR